MAGRKQAATEQEKQEASPKPPVAKDIQNGVTRPKEGTQTGRVWEIADAISAEKGEPAPRKDVLAQFMEEGGNPSTGATQYGRWRKYHGLAQETGKPGRPKKQAEAPEEPTGAETAVEDDAPHDAAAEAGAEEEA